MPLNALDYPGPDRRRKRLAARWLILAFAIGAVIVFATLCPLQWRPRLTGDPNEERFGAYAILGFAAKLALPRKQAWPLFVVVVLALALEAAQLFVPGRDGRLADAAVKALGGVVGVQAGQLSFLFKRVWARSTNRALLKPPNVPG